MRTLLRITKIIIETTTEDSGVWIHVTAQEVIKDDTGETIQVIPSDHFIHFKLIDVALDMFQSKDPVTGETFSHSGAVVGVGVDTIVKYKLQEKYGGTLEDNTLWLS